MKKSGVVGTDGSQQSRADGKGRKEDDNLESE